MNTSLKNAQLFKHAGKTLIIFVGLSALGLLSFIYLWFIYPSEKIEKEILPSLQSFTKNFSHCANKPKECEDLLCPSIKTENNIEGFIKSMEAAHAKYGKRIDCSINPSSILVQGIFSKKSNFDFQSYFQCEAEYQTENSSKYLVLENWLVLVKSLGVEKKLCLFSLKSK